MCFLCAESMMLVYNLGNVCVCVWRGHAVKRQRERGFDREKEREREKKSPNGPRVSQCGFHMPRRYFLVNTHSLLEYGISYKYPHSFACLNTVSLSRSLQSSLLLSLQSATVITKTQSHRYNFSQVLILLHHSYYIFCKLVI